MITDKYIENRIEEINKELEKIRKVEKKFPQGELILTFSSVTPRRCGFLGA